MLKGSREGGRGSLRHVAPAFPPTQSVPSVLPGTLWNLYRSCEYLPDAWHASSWVTVRVLVSGAKDSAVIRRIYLIAWYCLHAHGTLGVFVVSGVRGWPAWLVCCRTPHLGYVMHCPSMHFVDVSMAGAGDD